MTRFLSPEKLAERWDCSTKKLAQDRQRGTGPQYVKLGDGRTAPIRYPLESVEAYEAEIMRRSTAANRTTLPDTRIAAEGMVRTGTR